MRVVCVKLLDAKSRETQTSAWVTLDAEYVVLAIQATPDGRVQLRIVSDDGTTPVLFESEMFMTVSTDIPSNWVASIGERGFVDIAPAKWLRPGFWDDYFDRDPQAIADFEEEKSKILADVEAEQ